MHSMKVAQQIEITETYYFYHQYTVMCLLAVWEVR